MDVLELPVGATARERGRAHGETFKKQIGEVADIRLQLCIEQGRFSSNDQILDIARAHLPMLERFDADLSEELLGIAEASGRKPEEIVVVNHYTDLRDIDPADPVGARRGHEDGCSIVLLRSRAGTLLAQTWDMHGTALPYVMMMHVPEHQTSTGVTVPEAWLLSIMGCLGMTGMNRSGLGIAINNLRSTDARIGIVWPALVRRMLYSNSADAGRDLVLTAPLGSGHHYMVAGDRRAFGIETSGTLRKIVFDKAEGWYVHTNHCLDEGVAAVTEEREGSTSRERYHHLTESLMSKTLPTGASAMWRLISSHDGYPRSVCSHLATDEAPNAMATCGAILMDLRKRMVWAAKGCINEQHGEHYPFMEQGRA